MSLLEEALIISKRKFWILCLVAGALIVIVFGRYAIYHRFGMQPNVRRTQRVAQSYHHHNQSARRNRPARYVIRPMSQKTQRIGKNVPIYSRPGVKRQIGNTAKMVKKARTFGNLVQPQRIATANSRPAYVQISRQGRTLGWISRRVLRSTNRYMLPYVYTSQFWPSAVPDACEVASLKTAMSTQNKGMRVSLKQMVRAIPRTRNPNRGYTHNPYRYGSHATIYPDAMVKIARRYRARAKDITGASKAEFIRAVTHGKAVVFEGPYMMKKPGSDHDLTILGYKPHYFFVADPFARHQNSPKETWVSTSRLMKLFNRSFRHQRALVIG